MNADVPDEGSDGSEGGRMMGSEVAHPASAGRHHLTSTILATCAAIRLEEGWDRNVPTFANPNQVRTPVPTTLARRPPVSACPMYLTGLKSR